MTENTTNQIKELENQNQLRSDETTLLSKKHIVLKEILQEFIEEMYAFVSGILNLKHEIGLKKDGQLKAVFNSICEKLDNLNRKLGGEKEKGVSNRLFSSHELSGSTPSDSKPPSFEDKPMKYIDCDGICGFCAIKETCTNPKRQKLRDKYDKPSEQPPSYDRIMANYARGFSKENPSEHPKASDSWHTLAWHNKMKEKETTTPLMDTANIEQIIEIYDNGHENVFYPDMHILIEKVKLKKTIREAIENLRSGKHFEIAGVTMVCYYLKDHKKELEKWERMLKLEKEPTDTDSKPTRNCDGCDLWGECDHQGAYKIDGKWCYEKPPSNAINKWKELDNNVGLKGVIRKESSSEQEHPDKHVSLKKGIDEVNRENRRTIYEKEKEPPELHCHCCGKFVKEEKDCFCLKCFEDAKKYEGYTLTLTTDLEDIFKNLDGVEIPYNIILKLETFKEKYSVKTDV